MAEKKISIDDFNKDFFNSWTKIKRVEPHFIELTDEEGDNTTHEIDRIDLIFDDGSKISIFPSTYRHGHEVEEDDEEILSTLNIVEYKGKSINWRIPKE